MEYCTNGLEQRYEHAPINDCENRKKDEDRCFEKTVKNGAMVFSKIDELQKFHKTTTEEHMVLICSGNDGGSDEYAFWEDYKNRKKYMVKSL